MAAGCVWLLAGAILLPVRGAYYTTPALPNINTNNIIVVTKAAYGAVGDGVTTNTTAIQAAINQATLGGTTNGAAGGTVEIPPGVYLSGPLTLANSVNLQIDAGAILRMLPLGMYPGGTSNPATFISGSNLHDIEISGPGAIDGQGGPWWPYANTNGASRPSMISPSDCNRLLIQNITLSNSPMFHIAISGGSSANSTVQNVTVRAPSSEANPPSHNTDACDVDGTIILVQNCNISVGDDDFTCGGGTSGVLLTNNTYDTGHGISIGSYTDKGGVSNIMVINCTMNGTDNGIRIKSDDGRGGLVQNIAYYNIGMTNVNFPIQVYSYYEEIGTPSSISPYYAATQIVAAVSSSSYTPIYRNLTFSNINATSVSGFPIGILWARTEMPATNIVFDRVNVTGDRSFDVYNVSGAQFIDCKLQPSIGNSTFELYDAQLIITNSVPTNTLFTFNGLTTNGYVNTMAFYNATGSLANTNALGSGSLTLAASSLTVSNNLSLQPNTVVNFTLGTNAAGLAVAGNLTLGGTNNISAGPGFTNGTFNLMSYNGALSGTPPVLGTIPAGYSYSFNTGVAGLVKLVVNSPPAAPANLTASATNLAIHLAWNSVASATNYNLKRGTLSGSYPTIFSGLTATNYADAAVTNAVPYFYVVSAVGAGGESTNSLPASAIPLPSNQPTNLVLQASGGHLQLSWPQDHLGWRLQIQTNTLGLGLATNWVTVPNSTNVMATNIVVNPTNGAVFLRLVYP